MKKQTFVTREELVNWLKNINKPISILLRIRTDADKKMRKTSRFDKTIRNPFLGRLVKESIYEVVLGFDYALEVNKQRLTEGKDTDFTAQKNWFDNVAGAIVAHSTSGKLYVKTMLKSRVAFAYMDLNTNEIVDVKELDPFITPKKPSKKQKLSEQIIVMTPEIKNVSQIETDDVIMNVLK